MVMLTAMVMRLDGSHAALLRVRFKVMQRMLSNQKWTGFQLMTTAKLSDEALVAILAAHPALRDRVESIVRAVADCDGDLKEADAVEERIVEDMRLLGRVALQGWAEHQVDVTERDIRQQPQMHRQGKKNSAGSRNLVPSRS